MFRPVILAGVLSLFSLSAAQINGVSVEVGALDERGCSGTFVEHGLEHMTIVSAEPIRMFDSNGSGLAINDLDGDGLLDIVLANLDGANSILWNEGELVFQRQDLHMPGRIRGVNIVDVDGDKQPDIVLTSQLSAPLLWRNLGNLDFVREILPGVNRPAYAMNWGDLDLDGDLDLVTGSYDAELEKILRDSFLHGGGAGVYYYDNQQGRFVATRLAEQSQALTILFHDLNQDGFPDIAIGNDFAAPDQFWASGDAGWAELYPFPITTYSTMSFDAGDVDNDGQAEFFAADMKPYPGESYSAWQPVLQRMRGHESQIMQNVLQTWQDDGYRDNARLAGVFSTGWSWSSKFGDLDSDGYLDLYVVNGMIAEDLFPHLPGYELVEENQALRNTGDGRFMPAPDWNLGSTASGRGMSMADLDHDGDLDIVVNNLMSPAQLFENQLCTGNNLIVELRRTDVVNTYGIGARVTLYADTGQYHREVRAASGYLSGDPSQVHFGFPESSRLNHLEVDWGDGNISTIPDLIPNTHIIITFPELSD